MTAATSANRVFFGVSLTLAAVAWVIVLPPGSRYRRNYHRIGRIFYLIVALTNAVRLVIVMITSRQIRAARALLGWSQQELADRAIVSTNALMRLERGTVDTRLSTLTAVQRALAKGGIEFIPADAKGEGVRLASPAKD